MPTLSQLPAATAVTAADTIPVSQAGTLRSASLGVVFQSIQPTISVDSPSLVGRTSLGPGGPEQVDVGAGLSIVGSTLCANGLDHGSFPVASSLDPDIQLVASTAGTPVLLPVDEIRGLFSAGTNISINGSGVISVADGTSLVANPDLGNVIGSLAVVTKLSAQDVIPVRQSGNGRAIAYADLLDGMTIDQAQTAAAATDTDALWVSQETNLMARQTFSAIWSWMVGKLPNYAQPSVEVTADLGLQAGLHNGHILICSQPVQISRSIDLPDGFQCCVVNASSGNVSFGAGFTLSGGAVDLPPWQAATVRRLAYSGGILMFVSLPAQQGGVSIPGAVTGVSVSANGSAGFTAAWQPPAGSSGPLSYIVQYRITGSSAWTLASSAQTAASCTVTGLAASTSYDVTVQASNAAGTGPVSAIVTVTTQPANQTSVPDQVLGLSAVAASSTSVQVSWTGQTGVNAATSYTVQYRVSGGSAWTGSQTGVTTNEAVVSGLQSSTSYDFSVYGVNGSGSGSASSVAGAQTLAPSNPVTSISWNVPAAGPYVQGSGAIGVNARVTPGTAAIQFGASQSPTIPPTTWTLAVNVNSDLWGAYVPTPATAGNWYMWAEGSDGSCPTPYATPFVVQ